MRRSFKAVRDVVAKAMLQNSAVVSGRMFPECIKVVKSLTCPHEDKPILVEQIYLEDPSQEGKLKQTKLRTTPDATVSVDELSADLKTRVVFRSGTDGAIHLEVYQDDQVVFKKNLKEKHGPVCAHDAFNPRPVMFNSDGTKAIYLAEKKHPKADIWADEFKGDHIRGHEYKHHFGETCDDVYNIGVFFIDLKDLTVRAAKGLPKDIIPITATFIDSGSAEPQTNDRLLVTGYDSRKLVSGIKMCMDKPSAVYIFEDFETEDLFPKNKKEADKKKEEEDKKKGEKQEKPAKVTKLTDFPIAVFPTLSPSGKKLAFFFSRHYIETHLFTTGLAVRDMETGQTEVIIDSEEPSDQERALYVFYEAYHLLSWLNEDEIAFPSYDLGRSVLNFVHLSTKKRKMIVLSKEFETESVRILDSRTDNLLVVKSNFYFRGRLGLGKNWKTWGSVENFDPDTAISWEDKESQENLDYRIQQGDIEETKVGIRDVTGYIWYLKSYRDENGNEVPPQKRPLYVEFHGGPHYFSGAGYSTLMMVLLKQGFQIVTLNFSGSWSFGKSFNERLCGKVGEIDVDELIDWLEANKDKYDPNEVTFDGGSYSGLQSLALLQKHHKYFKNIIAYNPVVNMLSNIYQTDIPEWNYVEALGTQDRFDVERDLTDEQILQLKKLSPALQPYDKDIKTKVLFIIGDKDKRVPPSGCLYLFRKLHALGLNVRCVSYKDQGHGIRKPSFVLDYMMNIFDMVLDFESVEKTIKVKEEEKKPEREAAEKEEDLKESEKEEKKRELEAAFVDTHGDPTTTSA